MSQLETDLRTRLRALDLPDVPPTLDARLSAVVASRSNRRLPLLAVAAVAVVAVMLAGLALVRPFGGPNVGGVAAPLVPPPTGSQPPAFGASSTPGQSASDASGYAFPETVDGLRVLTVAELIDARSTRKPGQPFALKGFWSAPGLAHSCPAPMSSSGITSTGVLELYCHDGEFGITQEDAPVVIVKHVGNMTYTEQGTKGPVLTPYVPDAMGQQLYLPATNGQAYPPVPIVVVGHFDDPLATECRPEARQLCKDRLVVDKIALFALDAVPSPGITPVPTPYQPAPSETPLFDPESCFAGTVGKPSTLSYAGWMDGGDLKLTSGLDLSGTTVWVAVTKDAVPLGDWFLMPGDSRESLAMGRLVCYAFGGVPGTQGVALDSLAGTFYRVYHDGSTSRPTSAP